MSLVGRLDDLSLPDIIQIVHLSRRTGTLEITDGAGKHALVFSRGLIVNVAGPRDAGFVEFLVARGDLQREHLSVVRRLCEGGTPPGDAILDLNLTDPNTLATAVRERAMAIIQPLLASTEGEFSFQLSEGIPPSVIGFDPKRLFKEGGLLPQALLQGDKGKLKPLRGIEESLKAGKALIRAAVTPPAASENAEDFAVVPAPLEEVEETPRVVVFERNASLRVAIRRRFAHENVRTAQFGTIDAMRSAVDELIACKRFFVTVLERTSDKSADRLLRSIKRRNAGLPVILLQSESGLPATEADRCIVRPAAENDATVLDCARLDDFADDVVLSAQYAMEEWDRVAEGGDEDLARFYEHAQKENLGRRSRAARKLITGLSDPNNVTEVASTILALLGDYVDRGALFVVAGEQFVGIGAFGGEGGESHRRIVRTTIPRTAPSILNEVAASLLPHRGKLRRTEANVALMQRLGEGHPTEVVALPIVHDGNTIAVLYGDNAGAREPIENTAVIESFLYHASESFAAALFGFYKLGAC